MSLCLNANVALRLSKFYYRKLLLLLLPNDISLASDSGRRLLRVASDRTDVVPRTHRSFSGRHFGISLVCMCGTVYLPSSLRHHIMTLATDSLSGSTENTSICRVNSKFYYAIQLTSNSQIS